MQKRSGSRAANLVHFLEVAYALEVDDQTWLREVMEASQRVWGRSGGWIQGALYDASDAGAFRPIAMHVIGGPEQATALFGRGVQLFTRQYVIRSFRTTTAAWCRGISEPELTEMFSGMQALGYPDALGLNSLDPTGMGVFLSHWVAKREAISETEMRVYRQMSHHLAAAHRCRRRLRQAQPIGVLDPTCDAEAVLDAKARVVHAVGSAREKRALEALVATAKARDLAHTTRVDPLDELGRWSPLTSARWSLVDSFERSGHRYIVARENRARVSGLEALSDRERQVVAYLAMGQSTKETAYALGISDVTVRVLLARAATKLGVKSRSGVLAHPEVQSLVSGSHRS